MKIFICCSKHFYRKIPPIKEALEKQRHIIALPNSYDEPMKEEQLKISAENSEYISWKANIIKAQETKIRDNDAILVLNFEKNGQPDYIGGATFLEIFKAFELEKKIFLYNSIPENILKDEIIGMNPIIINGDLLKII